MAQVGPSMQNMMSQAADGMWMLPTCPSIGSAETLTPPSGANERLGITSGTGNSEPGSRSVSGQDSQCGCAYQDVHDHATPTTSTTISSFSGNLRRRKYTLPQNAFNDCIAVVERPVKALHRDLGGVPAKAVSARPCGGNKARPGTVLIEGPLQQQSFLSLWWWRWCVLDEQELRMYDSQQASVLEPHRPLQRHRMVSLEVAFDLCSPQVLVLQLGAERAGQVAVLRTGRGARWEEIAAARLWCQAFAAVG